MGLLRKLTTTVLVPAALGAALLYAATHVGGSGAQWLYVMGSWGVLMVMMAVMFWRIAYLEHHSRLLEDQIATLNRQVRDIKEDVDDHLIIKQMRQAGLTHYWRAEGN